jgi:hypothetical protein
MFKVMPVDLQSYLHRSIVYAYVSQVCFNTSKLSRSTTQKSPTTSTLLHAHSLTPSESPPCWLQPHGWQPPSYRHACTSVVSGRYVSPILSNSALPFPRLRNCKLLSIVLCEIVVSGEVAKVASYAAEICGRSTESTMELE